MRKMMRGALTPKNVLATLALLVSLSGTAYAATQVSGASFANGSLTGVQVKNGSLYPMNFSQAALAALHAVKGAQGKPGPAATAKGQPGPQGPQGPAGDPAHHAYSYSDGDDNHQFIKAPDINPPLGQNCACPTTYFPRWNYQCTLPTKYCNETTNLGTYSRLLDTSYHQVLTFPSASNGGFLTLDHTGSVVVTGTGSFLHVPGDQASRVQCRVQSLDVTDSVVTTSPLGVPISVSSNLDDQLVNVTATGAIHVTVTPGSPRKYEFAFTCRELDDSNPNNSATDWYFVKGNVNAISAEWP
jgi:hypothetical protein